MITNEEEETQFQAVVKRVGVVVRRKPVFFQVSNGGVSDASIALTQEEMGC